MSSRTFLFVFVLAALVTISSCTRTVPSNTPAPASPTPAAKKFSPAELAKLRWIEGSWRGTGDVETPFYERYHFENDSTLVVDSFADDKFSKISETSRFELKDGKFGNVGEGARWAAIAIDDNSISFEPTAKAQNSFRWERVSAGPQPNEWKAVLWWPAANNKPAGQRVYRMERWPLPKP
jgi:hypothetical protein